MSYGDYVIAGHGQSFSAVFLSLMATVVGASATLGIAARAEQTGFPAIWWLLSGASGLLLQAVFISGKLRAYHVCTLPELVKTIAGVKSGKFVSVVIVVSWIGIIAAQFVAISQILSGILNVQNFRIILLGSGIFVMLYTLWGGQLSVIRTDMIQSVILFTGFLLVFILVCIRMNDLPCPDCRPWKNLELFNRHFRWMDALVMFFTVGGAYFLGPDILTRNMIAKDSRTARKAVFAGAIAVAVFAVVITMIGMSARSLVPGNGNPLIRLIVNGLPLPFSVLLTLAVVSALLSSADTCLINASAILAQDIFGSKKIRTVKTAVAAVGFVSLAVACYGGDIISLLLGAYTIYTSGVVCPLAVAVLCPANKMIQENIWLAGVLSGGGAGLLSEMIPGTSVWLPLAGMALSALAALLSLRPRICRSGIGILSEVPECPLREYPGGN